MAASMRLRVKLSEATLARFAGLGIDIPWDEREELDVRFPEPPLTVEDLSEWIEARVEGLYWRQTGGTGAVQVQVRAMKRLGSSDVLPFDDHADRHLKDGDSVVVDCLAVTAPMARQPGQPRPALSDAELNAIRKDLRFDLNDRVLCNVGDRWLSGHVVGTAVNDEDGVLPYIVKTDFIPGLPSRVISVPSDEDEVCVQEVCFDPQSQLQLVKAAAALVAGSARPGLRFAAGDRVVCRLRNSAEDGLECWGAGTVASTWPQLPGDRSWELDGVSGEFPEAVPYQVSLSAGGWVYCHRDHHTLIRREGLQPQVRVKGTSKRMEVRRAADGSTEKVDHQTGKSKHLPDGELDSE